MLIPNLPSPDPLECTNLAASPDLGLIQPRKCLSGEYLPSLTLSFPKEGIEIILQSFKKRTLTCSSLAQI